MVEKGVDVDQVMEAVNRAVAAPGILRADFWKEMDSEHPNLAFVYPPYSKSLRVNLDLVSRNWEVDGEFDIGSRVPLVGGLVVVFKKALRALMRWYVTPVTQQVKKFNMLVTRTLNDLNNNLEELQDRITILEKADVERRVAELEEREGIARGEEGE